MSVRLRQSLLAALAASAVAWSVAPGVAGATRAHDTTPASLVHLRLEKSEPAKGETVTASPTVIRLWFSLPAELAVTTVKLTDAAGAQIVVGAPRRAAPPKSPVEFDVKAPLAPGAYTVTWKTASRDGHPMTGDFAFTVGNPAP